jgi:hypothetical protein
MARALAAVGAALVFLLLVLGAVVYLNRDEDAIAVDNLLAENVTREIARSDTVDLSDVTDFKWDHVLIAEHDASRAAISKALGAPWEGDIAFGAGDVLIFVRGGHVARYADYRGEGRFEGLRRPVARLARDQARFTVRDLVIRPASSP